jgi:serine/threonine protein kinase
MSSFSLRDGFVVAERYRIAEPLGHGAYGAVYAAERADDKARVAVKLMHERHADTTDALRFDREAALLQRLHDPHVVEILDFGHFDDMPFLVFELLEGRTLAEELEAIGPLGVERCARVARQILSALQAAHTLSIVHRDVKPANIFLCEGDTDRVKVLDFGTAKALGEDAGQALTATGQMLGTAQYMAPEQVRGEPVDETADIYSLGTVMAEMITGDKLVTGDNVIDVYMMHVANTPLDLPAVVADCLLGPIIKKALGKTSALRYESVSAMAVEVDRVLSAFAPVAPLPATAAAALPMASPARPQPPAPPADPSALLVSVDDATTHQGWVLPVLVTVLCLIAGAAAAMMLL